MKKYTAFILSLTLLYIGFQILSGWILTAFYTPDLSSINADPREDAVFELSSTFQFLAVLLIATLAYFISQKLPASSDKA